MRPSRVGVAVAAFIVLSVAGCGLGSGSALSSGAGGVSPKGSDVAWGDGAPAQVTSVDLSTAQVARPGRDYTITTEIPEGTFDKTYYVPYALQGDAPLVGQVPGNSYDGGEWLSAPEQMGLYRDGKFESFGPSVPISGDHPRQASAMSSDGSTVVWMESDNTDLYQSNWRVFSWKPGGKITLVARSEEVITGKMPLLDMNSGPIVAHGRVYIPSPAAPGAFPATDASKTEMAVFSKAVDGTGALRRDAADATSPAVDGDKVLAIGLAGSSWGRKIIDIGARKGSSTVLQGTDTRVFWGSLTAADGKFAFEAYLRQDGGGETQSPTSTPTAAAQGTVYLADPSKHVVTEFPLGNDGLSTQPMLCGSHLVWTSATGDGSRPTEPVYVYDTTDKKLWRIDRDHAYGGIYCSGDYIGWDSIDPTSGLTASTTVARWHPEAK